MDLPAIFEDENLRYYIHGTGRNGDDADGVITNSVFENGLLMYSAEGGQNSEALDLTATAHPIGDGSKSLYREVGYDALHNNPHMESKRTIIIALPTAYIFPKLYLFDDMREAAFTENKEFFTSKEQEEVYKQNNMEEIPSYRVLMSEFIVGAYDATSHTFIPNKNFFKNSNTSNREAIFRKVHSNYIMYLKQQIKNAILNGTTQFVVDDFLSLFTKNNREIPLSAEEISDLKKFELEILKQKEAQEETVKNEDPYEDFLRLG